jgi:hypothetical protein
MGKSAKKIIGIAVAIAVPFVAPKIVGALAASAMVKGTALGAALATTAGATAGGALVGAGLGAIGAKISGADVGRGALFGALGGGYGGYSAATAAGAGGAGGVDYGLGGTGARLGEAAGAGVTADPYSLAGTGAQLGTTGITGTAGLAATSPYALAGTGAALPSFGAASTGAVAGSFTEALAAMPGEIANRFSDPKQLADMTLRAGASLLTGQLAGDGLSPEEQQLLQAQMQDLQSLREQNEELFKTRVQEAMNLLGEARYFDPEKFGFQAQAAIKVAGAQQLREAERAAALRPGQAGISEADRRRAGLDITARGQTAYLGAADAAQRQRMLTYQSGLAALPQSGPTSGLQYAGNLMEMYDAANKRKKDLETSMGSWFGGITGENKAASIG